MPGYAVEAHVRPLVAAVPIEREKELRASRGPRYSRRLLLPDEHECVADPARVSQPTPLRRPLSRTVEDSTDQGVPNSVFVGQQQESGDHDNDSRKLQKGGRR